MKRIAQLTNAPEETLEGGIPKLERLGQILDRYNNVHFRIRKVKNNASSINIFHAILIKERF